MFSWTYCSFICLLWKNCAAHLCMFYQMFGFWLLSCMSSSYILDVNPVSDIWFADMFSHSVDCLFILLFLLLCRCFLVWYNPAYLFLFCYLCFGDCVQEDLTQVQHVFFLLLHFIFSALTCIPIIYFWVNFVVWSKEGIQTPPCRYSVVQALILKFVTCLFNLGKP